MHPPTHAHVSGLRDRLKLAPEEHGDDPHVRGDPGLPGAGREPGIPLIGGRGQGPAQSHASHPGVHPNTGSGR